jgi:glycerol-3-phosphate acyltransferase PlsY
MDNTMTTCFMNTCWTCEAMNLGMFFLGAYLIGSIPFGYILTKLSGRGDIRNIGSGNIGATNVLRTGSKKLAIFTLLGDLLKGFIPVYFLMHTLMDLDIIHSTMACLLIGHLFPVWLKFNGGKGVATYGGILLAYSPILGGIAVAVWLLTLKLSKISSLSALVSTLVIILLVLIQWPVPTYQSSKSLFVFLTLLIWWRHKDNIQRLIKGTEPKAGKKQ